MYLFHFQEGRKLACCLREPGGSYTNPMGMRQFSRQRVKMVGWLKVEGNPESKHNLKTALT